jgi:DNA-binding LacI/PurR family transcriptional regulator
VDKRRLSGLLKPPRYKQVFDELLSGIQEGKYPPGQKLPSETALATRFRTSRITIGRALRELKQRGLLTGVAGSGNFVAGTGQPNQGLVFGLLIPNLGETEIFEPICQGIANAPEAGSYALLWGHAKAEAAPEQQALELCRQYIDRKVSGVFFAPLEWAADKDRVNAQICALFDAARIPVVLLDRCVLSFPQRSKYDLVGIDNRRAGYLATEHLLDLGCRDVAFLARQGAAPTVDARIAGYREALFARGLAIEEKRVQRFESVSHEALEQAFKAADSSAFVCANDHTASLLLQALQVAGLRVPQDVRVVGIDDVDYARLLPVPLTTIQQPSRAIGEAAITAMLTRRERPAMLPRDILLDCRLIVRKSSADIRGH